MKKTVIIYGICLATLAFLLKTIEYKWLLKDISLNFYLFMVAVIFCLLGIWMSHKIVNKNRSEEKFVKNYQAIESLGLSERELQVLEKMIEGHSNKKIAELLFISINTVKSHIKNAYDKLEVNNRILAIEKLKTLNIFKK